jgi:hypothetical protein
LGGLPDAISANPRVASFQCLGAPMSSLPIQQKDFGEFVGCYKAGKMYNFEEVTKAG